jgi:WD40 repeat protein
MSNQFSPSLVTSMQAHSSWVESVIFSPNSQFLISASFDKMIKFWHYDGKKFHLLKVLIEPSEVISIALSRDGKLLASSNHSGEIKLWKIPEGRLLKKFTLKWDNVLDFSPDGRLLALGSSGGGSVNLLKIQDGKTILIFNEPFTIWSVKFSPDGRYLAFACDRSRDRKSTGVIIWQVKEKTWKWVYKEEMGDSITCISWSSNGQFLVAGSLMGHIRIWDVSNMQNLKQVQHIMAKSGGFWSIGLFRNDKLLAAAGVRSVTIADIQRRMVVWRWVIPKPQEENATALSISKDGSLMAVGFSSGKINIWKLR